MVLDKKNGRRKSIHRSFPQQVYMYVSSPFLLTPVAFHFFSFHPHLFPFPRSSQLPLSCPICHWSCRRKGPRKGGLKESLSTCMRFNYYYGSFCALARSNLCVCCPANDFRFTYLIVLASVGDLAQENKLIYLFIYFKHIQIQWNS